MLHTVLLGVRIAAGTSGLLLGPLALAVPQRAGWHSRLGVAYQGAVAVMTASALGLVGLAPGRLWWLGLIAVATEAAALAGWAVRLRHSSLASRLRHGCPERLLGRVPVRALTVGGTYGRA